jgi:uncharacterized protein YdeI (YjbR/CyaY-like superfamily)
VPARKQSAPAPMFFPKPEAFRRWLHKNHASVDQLWVGFYKVGSGKPSLTWPQSVDQALCYGWIDGIRKTIDADSYKIRFTPRKAGSNWSAVNIKRAGELTKEGLVEPAGIAAFEKRDEAKSRVYSFERESATLGPAHEKQFRANRKAWKFFEAQPPGYRKLMAHWVESAKQEETRQRRLAMLMAESDAGKRVDQSSPRKRRSESQ